MVPKGGWPALRPAVQDPGGLLPSLRASVNKERDHLIPAPAVRRGQAGGVSWLPPEPQSPDRGPGKGRAR